MKNKTVTGVRAIMMVAMLLSIGVLANAQSNQSTKKSVKDTTKKAAWVAPAKETPKKTSYYQQKKVEPTAKDKKSDKH